MDFLRTIKFPLICIAIVSIVLNIFIGQEFELLVFNILRLLFIVWAGWLAISYKPRSYWWCTVAGAAMLFLSHVIISGGHFLIQAEFQAFLGVLVSYVVFVIVAVLLAIFGGFLSVLFNAKNT